MCTLCFVSIRFYALELRCAQFTLAQRGIFASCIITRLEIALGEDEAANASILEASYFKACTSSTQHPISYARRRNNGCGSSMAAW